MRRNMTQRELANAIEGIGESALRSYELGERSPKQDALERIAKALDVAPGEMRLHAGSVNVESSEDGAAHYLETAKHLNEYLNDHGTGR